MATTNRSTSLLSRTILPSRVQAHTGLLYTLQQQHTHTHIESIIHPTTHETHDNYHRHYMHATTRHEVRDTVVYTPHPTRPSVPATSYCSNRAQTRVCTVLYCTVLSYRKNTILEDYVQEVGSAVKEVKQASTAVSCMHTRTFIIFYRRMDSTVFIHIHICTYILPSRSSLFFID